MNLHLTIENLLPFYYRRCQEIGVVGTRICLASSILLILRIVEAVCAAKITQTCMVICAYCSNRLHVLYSCDDISINIGA